MKMIKLTRTVFPWLTLGLVWLFIILPALSSRLPYIMAIAAVGTGITGILAGYIYGRFYQRSSQNTAPQ